MDERATSQPVEVPTDRTSQPIVVRMIVISNSQIISSVTRTASLVVFLAVGLQFLLRVVSAGKLREIGKSFDVALIASGAVLLILSQILDRALRRCPICRTRITRKTEEKRRCLECDTELWGYWDE